MNSNQDIDIILSLVVLFVFKVNFPELLRASTKLLSAGFEGKKDIKSCLT